MRAAILAAARTRLSRDGAEALSLSEVAHLAGVNRGTAYQHFASREKLIQATVESVGDQLFEAIFGDLDGPAEDIDVALLADRLAEFAMDNPELCRIWLLQVLSSPDPAGDPFWQRYEGSLARFAQTVLAQHNLDSEVLSVIMLAGAFLWPVWASANATSEDEKRDLARRFARESLRLAMSGALRPDSFPEIAQRLTARPDPPPKLASCAGET